MEAGPRDRLPPGWTQLSREGQGTLPGGERDGQGARQVLTLRQPNCCNPNTSSRPPSPNPVFTVAPRFGCCLTALLLAQSWVKREASGTSARASFLSLAGWRPPPADQVPLLVGPASWGPPASPGRACEAASECPTISWTLRGESRAMALLLLSPVTKRCAPRAGGVLSGRGLFPPCGNPHSVQAQRLGRGGRGSLLLLQSMVQSHTLCKGDDVSPDRSQ